MATNKNHGGNDNNTSAKLITLGVGVAALAAGAYFFFGPDGKKHQKKMRGWMVRMKGEILEKLEAAQEVTEPIYHKIVDTVAAAQALSGQVSKEEIDELADELKKKWRVISRSLKQMTRPAAKVGTRKKASTR